KTATSNAGVWQANFMGGGRLHQLLNKISQQTTLGAYLDEMVESNGWKVAEGWIESADSKDIKRVKHLSIKNELSEEEKIEFFNLETRYKADWINGFNYVETSDFDENGISKESVSDSLYFLRPRRKNKEIFQPPHLLI